MPGYFEEVSVGHVAPLGHAAVDAEAARAFAATFAPGWDIEQGLPDALVYAVWSKLDAAASAGWPQTKRVATDALRFARNPAAGELLRGRMTVLGKDPVGEAKGIILAQHDLLDEAGRLVFSCLTRSVFACA
jgi:acyl dehydratase